MPLYHLGFNPINSFNYLAEEKMDRDELMVTIVEQEYVIWKRNHPHFKNAAMKEQAWARVALQLGISREYFWCILQSYTFVKFSSALTIITINQLKDG
jgi:Alcohol dehydrogenase transcription factor Myb/SANT-like